MGVYPDFGQELSRAVGQAAVMYSYLTTDLGGPEAQLVTLTGIIAGDGRLYRAAVYQDVAGGLIGECFNFPPPFPPTYAFGQGETLAECRDDLRDGINAALGGPE